MNSKFAVGYCSDRGVTHEVNQDSLCLKQLVGVGHELLVAGLFDGMGGLREGERVSGAAAKAVAQWAEANTNILFSGNSQEIREKLLSALDELNDKVRAFSKRADVEAGTTAAILILGNRRFVVCNVGDSRIYHLSEKGAQRLSRDHNLAASLVEAGLLTEQEADRHPQRNVLTQAIGTLEKISPHYLVGEYKPEGSFLLCSDGFYDRLSEEELQELARVAPEKDAMTEALKRLTANVIQRGETDNISSLLIKAVK